MLSHILPCQADLDQSHSQLPSFWEHHTYALCPGLSRVQKSKCIYDEKFSATAFWSDPGMTLNRDNILPIKKYSSFFSHHFKYLEILHVFPNRSRHQEKRKKKPYNVFIIFSNAIWAPSWTRTYKSFWAVVLNTGKISAGQAGGLSLYLNTCNRLERMCMTNYKNVHTKIETQILFF